ncbi:helix-turn-helix transcriptional regulator [Caldalkalibacillus mannanilyticus]|uniref:helix-turn-helix transcriptional regulator n=1 Tax=Caldalkalibacillus mannanilyticus TaxID=1418 RepID=UPI00046ADF66|nr:AraC family transcriptional regulator [Caldalkalibacillus mannanilyticus]
MINDKALSEQLSSYFYILEEMTHVHSAKVTPEQYNRDFHVILVCMEGQGNIEIDERRYDVDSPKVYIWSPDSRVTLSFHADQRVHYYLISFTPLQVIDARYIALRKLGCPEELSVKNIHFLMEMVNDVEKKFHSQHTWSKAKANSSFQEMIVFLFHECMHNEALDLPGAIALTKEYIEHNYRLNITRKMLAEMAGVSMDYYSRCFKKELGKSPMDYVTEVRMKKAKQLLILSDDKLSAIAQKVGFHDEFYFSRKFKATTGYSPTAYIKKSKTPSS